MSTPAVAIFTLVLGVGATTPGGVEAPRFGVAGISLLGPAATEPADPSAQPDPPPDAALPASPSEPPADEPSPDPSAEPSAGAEPSTEPVTDPAPAEELAPEEVPATAEPDTPAAQPTTAETPAVEAAEPDVSMDDIFGTSEENTAVEVISETPRADADAAPAAATAAKQTRGQKFLADLDTRVRIVSSIYYDIARAEERQFSRNENRLEFYFSYSPNKHLQIVGDVEPVFFGVAQTQELDDLASRQMLTPFHVESDAAYVAVNDLLPKFDIKVGRQIVVWGTADKFNPTNNINPDDLEDRPLFTEPIANQMVVVDYAPLDDKLWFQGVYVPLFYPALLPPSAAAGLTDPQAPVPYARDSDERKIGELQSLLGRNEGLVPTVTSSVIMPKRRFSDGQSAIKLGSSLGGFDLSLSYYNGRHDIPTPVRADSSTKDPVEGPVTDAECCYRSHVQLVYPRMQVVGMDFATQVPFLGNLGLWGEGGLFFPGKQDLFLEFPIPVDVTPDDGEVNPISSLSGPSIRSTPFVKATAGVDYTFGKHVYVQGQYLRGFIDEFGVDHIGNYAVAGTDLIFFGRHLVFRLFGVVDFPTGRGDDGSYVIAPALLLTPPWGSVTFELGSFALIGGEDTKFGQKATGSSIAYFKLTGTF